MSEKSAILKNGAILRKRRNARGKVTKLSAMNPWMLTQVLEALALLVESNFGFQNSNFSKLTHNSVFFSKGNACKENQVIFEKLEFWTPNFDSTSNARADNLVTFPLAFLLFLKIPPFFKITDFSDICPHSRGKMLMRGTARGKINKFLRLPRCIVLSKKRGHSYI